MNSARVPRLPEGTSPKPPFVIARQGPISVLLYRPALGLFVELDLPKKGSAHVGQRVGMR
jgi:hypothetical protein